MLVQFQLDNKKTKEVQTLKNIGIEVCKICCFGGCNWKGPKEILDALVAFLQENIPIIEFFLEDQTTFSGKQRKESENLEKVMMQCMDTFFGISYDDLPKYFAIINGVLLVNPAAIPILLKYLFESLIEENGSINEDASLIGAKALLTLKYTQENLASVIGTLTHTWTFTQGNSNAPIIGADYVMMKQQEPQDPKDRQKALEYILYDVIYGAFYFGVGNCQIMAEVAFLLAIQSIQNTPIRYIQFLQTERNVEELNAIVIGDWPKTGCRILAPWESTEPFLWNGSFENTPQLQNYNTDKTFFSIKTEKERNSYFIILERNGFNPSKLLVSNERNTHVSVNEEICRKILAIVQKKDPVERPVNGK